MTQKSSPRELNRIVQEHNELITMISNLRSWLAEVAELGIPHFGELGSRLEPLFRMLCEHFAHEEEMGYMADAIAAAPHLTREADQLLAEHAVLKNELESLIHRLRSSEAPFSSWQEAYEKVEGLCADLERHEQCEIGFQNAAFGKPR